MKSIKKMIRITGFLVILTTFSILSCNNSPVSTEEENPFPVSISRVDIKYGIGDNYDTSKRDEHLCPFF